VSLLLSQPELLRAREAATRGEISAELYAWLGRLIALAQATRALAPAPVPGGRWDDPDAVTETLHAWLEESLLRGGLLQALDRCATPRALARYLERALRNWLIARSRRASGPRLLERAGELMSGDPAFRLLRPAPSPADRWWTLATREDPRLYSGTDATLVSGAWALGDFALLRYPSSERSDPVLSTPDLRRFLYGLLEAAQASITGRHIDTTLRARFAYATSPSCADASKTSAKHRFQRPDKLLRQLVAQAVIPRGDLEHLTAHLEPGGQLRRVGGVPEGCPQKRPRDEELAGEGVGLALRCRAVAVTSLQEVMAKLVRNREPLRKGSLGGVDLDHRAHQPRPEIPETMALTNLEAEPTCDGMHDDWRAYKPMVARNLPPLETRVTGMRPLRLRRFRAPELARTIVVNADDHRLATARNALRPLRQPGPLEPLVPALLLRAAQQRHRVKSQHPALPRRRRQTGHTTAYPRLAYPKGLSL